MLNMTKKVTIAVFCLSAIYATPSYANKVLRPGSSKITGIFRLDTARIKSATDWLIKGGTTGSYGLRSVKQSATRPLVRTFDGESLMVLLGRNSKKADVMEIEIGLYLGKMSSEIPAFEDIIAYSNKVIGNSTQVLDDTIEQSIQYWASKRGIALELVSDPNVPNIYKTGVRNEKTGQLAISRTFSVKGTNSVTDLRRFIKEIHEAIETQDGLLNL